MYLTVLLRRKLGLNLVKSGDYLLVHLLLWTKTYYYKPIIILIYDFYIVLQ